MNSDLEHRRLHQLADRLESRLNTVQVLAEVILDNAAMREGIPGPYLDDVRETALMDALRDTGVRNLSARSLLGNGVSLSRNGAFVDACDVEAAHPTARTHPFESSVRIATNKADDS